jgi:hypothetical protein
MRVVDLILKYALERSSGLVTTGRAGLWPPLRPADFLAFLKTCDRKQSAGSWLRNLESVLLMCPLRISSSKEKTSSGFSPGNDY